MLGLVAGVVALTAALPVAAGRPEEPRPWAAGVSVERQDGAKWLFDEGNRAFEESKYGVALEKYREALSFWDHPIIHFNIAVCLIHLDRPVPAYEHLRQAMSVGPGPLGEDLHSQGQTYEKLLLGRLARIQVSCSQPGVEVSLDGQALVACPGRATRVILPGHHQIVARKPGLLTDARNVSLLPGRLQVEQIALVPAPTTARLERRWRVWVPWLVVGSGVGLAAVGLGLRRMATSDFDRYDRAFAQACPDGCAEAEVPDSVQDIGDRAQRENSAAIASVSVGAALIGVGGALLFFNQPRPVDEGARATAGAARVLPLFPRNGIGLAVRVRF